MIFKSVDKAEKKQPNKLKVASWAGHTVPVKGYQYTGQL